MIFSTTRRFFTVLRYFGRYRIDIYIMPLMRKSYLKYLFFLNPWRWVPIRKHNRAIRLRMMLEQLGPIFIKFGQILSTRKDLLPPDIAAELAKLQDAVPPFPGKTAINIIESELQGPIHQFFKAFDPTALASASIAQVHCATLHNDREVVVKVLRPQVRQKVTRDLALLYFAAQLATRLWADGPRMHATEVVSEFDHTLQDELNLISEGANASQLRRNFADSPIIYVPEVFFSLTTMRVLTMERIYGVPISDIETLKANNVNLKKLAEYGVEIFFTQVFRDCFFHADMHPGNVFVDISDPENPRYCAVDFGIMGTLDTRDQRYLAENFLAFFQRNYRRVAELHIESGWVPADTRVDQFESAIRAVCEPIFQQPLAEISFAKMLIQLFHTARRFNMHIQPQLILLQKTLFNIEGLGRQLYPELDLWHTAKPFLEKWLRQRLSVGAFARQVRDLAPYWLEKTPDLPMLIHRSLIKFTEAAENKPTAALISIPSQATLRRNLLPFAIANCALVAGYYWHAISANYTILACVGLNMLILFQRYSPERLSPEKV